LQIIGRVKLGAVPLAFDAALVAAALVVGLYAAAVVALVVAGRRGDAAALARFAPDCVVLVRRLLGDPRMPRRARLVLGGLLLYLVSPIDLVPDFVPVAGQLDDAIVLALGLRWLLRSAGPAIVTAHWPGPERSLAVVLRVAQRPGGWRTT
jgi:uncharacterized membrane protein YkvA (DUF1232 family)